MDTLAIHYPRAVSSYDVTGQRAVLDYFKSNCRQQNRRRPVSISINQKAALVAQVEAPKYNRLPFVENCGLKKLAITKVSGRRVSNEPDVPRINSPGGSASVHTSNPDLIRIGIAGMTGLDNLV